MLRESSRLSLALLSSACCAMLLVPSSIARHSYACTATNITTWKDSNSLLTSEAPHATHQASSGASHRASYKLRVIKVSRT